MAAGLWFSFATVVSVVGLAHGLKEDTPCPNFKPVDRLDEAKYLGVWYEALALPQFFVPLGSKCGRATYATLENGSISVHNVNLRPGNIFSEVCGYATYKYANKSGSLEVKFPVAPVPAPYNVLFTDYDNYACVYSCYQSETRGKVELGWLLTRAKNPSKDVLEAGQKVFTSQGIDLTNFKPTVQDDSCVYENPVGESCASNPANLVRSVGVTIVIFSFFSSFVN